LTPQEKEIKTTELTKGLEAMKSLTKGDDWQVILQPNVLAIIGSLIQTLLQGFFSIFSSKAKGLFDSAAVRLETKLDSLIALQAKQIEVQTKILTHLENTCLKKADVQDIMGSFSNSVAETVAAKIPGELMRMEIAPAAMKFQRKS
jgi:hypothetical protein